MPKALVIPCYNEADRLPQDQLEDLLRGDPDLTVILVDDGSTDATRVLLTGLAGRNPRIKTHFLTHNHGKAEAVRAGLLYALNGGLNAFDYIGYADADFATPATEIVRLFDIAKNRRPELLIASRILLLGTDIQRKPVRHYLGRVFATFASQALQLNVYDTQCGAKFLRVSTELRQVLNEPFLSRWAFDVELIGRMSAAFSVRHRNTFIEVPLLEWRDIGGSKLTLKAMLRTGWDLWLIAWHLRRKRG
jgi:dolichyl-phosphate beta-glucosyltransferase